eukprot:124205_1
MAAHTTSTKCLFSIAHQLVQQIFPSIPQEAFNERGDMCFCLKCHETRGDKLTYKRGKPPKRYALPVGWVRLGLKVDTLKASMNNVWDEWHVAYHGTKKDIIPQIFKAGLHLLKPGDITMDGDELGVRSGHIKKPFKRKNKYTGEDEKFDPNQIYVSPSITYASHNAYAPSFECDHPTNQHKKISVRFAFQVRIKPDQYGIGQETVGAAQSDIILDPYFNNNELEWYTKQNVGIILYGLLLHITEINKFDTLNKISEAFSLRSINIFKGDKNCIIDLNKSLVTTKGVDAYNQCTYAIFQTPWSCSQDVYEFRIKCIESVGKAISIGMVSNPTASSKSLNWLFDSTECGISYQMYVFKDMNAIYHFNHGAEQLKQSISKFKRGSYSSGDIISMIADFRKLKLSFFINSKQVGKPVTIENSSFYPAIAYNVNDTGYEKTGALKMKVLHIDCNDSEEKSEDKFTLRSVDIFKGDDDCVIDLDNAVFTSKGSKVDNKCTFAIFQEPWTRSGIYRFKVKLLNTAKKAISIGMVTNKSATKKSLHWLFDLPECGTSYQMYGFSNSQMIYHYENGAEKYSEIISNKNTFKSGDTLSMVVDLNKCELSFFCNNKQRGKTVKIKKNIYYPAIAYNVYTPDKFSETGSPKIQVLALTFKKFTLRSVDIFKQDDDCVIDLDNAIFTTKGSKVDNKCTFAILPRWSGTGRHQFKLECIESAGKAISIGMVSKKPTSSGQFDWIFDMKECGVSYQMYVFIHKKNAIFNFDKGVEKYKQSIATFKRGGYKSGDIMSMVVDFDNLELSFYINAKQMGTIIKIKKNNYYPAIAYNVWISEQWDKTGPPKLKVLKLE